MQGDFLAQTPYAYFGARLLLGLKNNEFWKILISVMSYNFMIYGRKVLRESRASAKR